MQGTACLELLLLQPHRAPRAGGLGKRSQRDNSRTREKCHPVPPLQPLLSVLLTSATQEVMNWARWEWSINCKELDQGIDSRIRWSYHFVLKHLIVYTHQDFFDIVSFDKLNIWGRTDAGVVSMKYRVLVTFVTTISWTPTSAWHWKTRARCWH